LPDNALSQGTADWVDRETASSLPELRATREQPVMYRKGSMILRPGLRNTGVLESGAGPRHACHFRERAAAGSFSMGEQFEMCRCSVFTLRALGEAIWSSDVGKARMEVMS
jgi:hypothetical protein